MLSERLLLASSLLFVLVSFLFVGSVGASLEMWSRTYGGTSVDSAEALVQTSDGGYALAGYTWHIDTEIHDFWLVKTNEYGDMEWNQTYGGEGIEYAYALVETSDGGYALAGVQRSSDTESDDFWLAKTDEYGVIPEFPSWIILPLLITASLVILICKQRLTKQQATDRQ